MYNIVVIKNEGIAMFNVHKNLFNDYQDLLIKADKLSEENRILKYLNKLNEKNLQLEIKKLKR